MRKRNYRPNVDPAYGIPRHEMVDDIVNNRGLRKDIRHRRHLIQDVCDFCKKYIYIRRNFIGLRKRGYRMACRDCSYERNLNWGRDKIVGEFQRPQQEIN